MKVVMDMAISPNGFIAREDGDEDWLPAEGWAEFLQLARRFNNIVMGRETYEQVTARYKDYNFDSVECDYKVIVTHDIGFTAPEGYEVVHSPEEVVSFVESRHLSELFLIGGGKLNAEFAKRGLIDEIQLTITPYVIGKGRPFLSPDDYEFGLELIEHKELSKDRIQIRYRVKKD